ncbi:PfkB family carbohydrate kinase [Nocardioides marmorisolisilvae]|uniref:Carbohydrate kinase n=1 Tax=Nocardioides marmorisolisilvae TaxID=1542737 RepID=A0A3N0DZ72_9ACTN|nr:PfkB family carbohydrate kinase [Nocardioides marmorisolisilvae]RNL80861.1 carbohydrate kinase [Nocardioides marmorisolisilvae]
MIVVAGEALVDIGPDGTESVGGSPLNVAVALGHLETPTVLITELGNDARAASIRTYLHEHDVELVAATTGRASATAAVRFTDGEPAYDLDLAWTLPHQVLPDCDALHVGSLGTVLEPGRMSVLDLVEQAWARDVFVSYDPNVREPLPGGADQAWRDVESLADRSHLVKISDQDIALLHPGADPDDIARSLLGGERTELVIRTRGADGAVGYVETADGLLVVEVPVTPVAVVDTIGAGDAFTAAVLAVLLETGSFGDFGAGIPREQDRLRRLLTAAAEVAALSCGRPGAAPPSRSQLRPGWPG